MWPYLGVNCCVDWFVQATDEDTGLYGKITYSVVSGESS